MRFLPFVAVALVLAQAGGAAMLLLHGLVVLGALLAVAAVATLAVLVQARRAGRRPPPRVPEYVERESVHW